MCNVDSSAGRTHKNIWNLILIAIPIQKTWPRQSVGRFDGGGGGDDGGDGDYRRGEVYAAMITSNCNFLA